MEQNQMRNIIEALLIASDRPLAIEKIIEVLGEGQAALIRSLLTQLQMDYETSGRSYQLVEIAGGFQISTRAEYSPWLKKYFGTKLVSRLSRAGLETLSIIAYKQPLTRLDIENIRGISNSSGVIQTLLERDLIKIRGRKEVPGRPLLYGTTNEFLRYFGLKDLTELPRIEELAEIVAASGADNSSGENIQREISRSESADACATENADTNATELETQKEREKNGG